MKILVVGAGAIGGYFGARLAQAGRDVTFLIRPWRAEQLERDGLQIISPNGNLTIQSSTITSQEIHAPYDPIMLEREDPRAEQAIADMKPASAPKPSSIRSSTASSTSQFSPGPSANAPSSAASR